MCRIVGVWDLNSGKRYNLERLIISMRDTMKYGGPDDFGIYIDNYNKIGLGHRRLSIIDLSKKAHQPMNFKNYYIVYNGEVYNFKEIREELIKKGYKFKSSSDTEVVLKSFAEWGNKCVDKFRGFFSFAIWDKNEQRLTLFRDRIGVKPLYYYFKDNIFMFSSELKAFHQFSDFDKELNYRSLSKFFQFGYIWGSDSIFKYVKKLSPGHFLEVKKNGQIKETKYWEITEFYKNSFIKNKFEEIEEEIESLLIESFKYRLVSDVPVGVFLSGGIDSTSVATLLQINSSAKIKTFTIGFKEEEYDESRFAKRIANFLGTEHFELLCTLEDAYNLIEKIPIIYDEPFGDSSAIPTFFISKLARRYVKVALSGDGGDELFGGYTKYEFVKKFFNLPYFVRFILSNIVSLFSPFVIEKIFPLKQKYRNIREKYYKFCNMLKGKTISEMCYLSSVYTISNDFLKIRLSSPEFLKFEYSQYDPFTYMQIIDFKTYLPDDIMTKVDRASMSNSLEAREPFLDNKLIEYVFNVPSEFKYRHGKGKWILRKILYKYLPRELVERPKQGFEIPIYTWLKNSILLKYNEDFSEKFLIKQGIFDSKYITELINKFLNGKYVNPHLIWFIFIFQRWYKLWIEKE